MILEVKIEIIISILALIIALSSLIWNIYNAKKTDKVYVEVDFKHQIIFEICEATKQQNSSSGFLVSITNNSKRTIYVKNIFAKLYNKRHQYIESQILFDSTLFPIELKSLEYKEWFIDIKKLVDKTDSLFKHYRFFNIVVYDSIGNKYLSKKGTTLEILKWYENYGKLKML